MVTIELVKDGEAKTFFSAVMGQHSGKSHDAVEETIQIAVLGI